jgi:hypothetical protein
MLTKHLKTMIGDIEEDLHSVCRATVSHRHRFILLFNTCPSQLAWLHPRAEIELVLLASADDSPVLLAPHLARHISHRPADLLQL